MKEVIKTLLLGALGIIVFILIMALAIFLNTYVLGCYDSETGNYTCEV